MWVPSSTVIGTAPSCPAPEISLKPSCMPLDLSISRSTPTSLEILSRDGSQRVSHEKTQMPRGSWVPRQVINVLNIMKLLQYQGANSLRQHPEDIATQSLPQSAVKLTFYGDFRNEVFLAIVLPVPTASISKCSKLVGRRWRDLGVGSE